MTPERFQRIQSVLQRRQPDLTVLMDNVHKGHNLSAIVRSCDATNIFAVHAVKPSGAIRSHRDITSGSGKWVKTHVHQNTEDAITHLRAQGMQLLAAHLSDAAIDFRQADYTQPTAIILGGELEGVSDLARAEADQHIIIPMGGMVESFNVSVAAALILYEAHRQREAADMYTVSRLEPAMYKRTLFEWTQPTLARFYTRKGITYPELDDNGDIIETDMHRHVRLGKAD